MPTERDQNELATVMAKVQHHHQQAAAELANGDVEGAEYQLIQAHFALEDYLIEDGEDDG